VRLNRAIDLYIGELARRGRRPSTRATYERLLFDFADLVDPHGERPVDEIKPDDCRRFLDRWRDSSPSTLASGVSLLRGFFRFLEKVGHVPATPMDDSIERPRRHRPEDLPVVTTPGSDVAKLIFACRDFQELLCVGAAGYLARRRSALARARRSDADLESGLVRFVDKGGKVIEQPIPDEFLAVLREAEQHGVWDGPDDYLIPNRRKVTTNPKRRSSKIVYETVKKVGKRAGVNTHVHALRAAFAVEFLESHPGQLEALKELMGHDRIETTMVYLRRMNRAKAMESVRDLSFGFSPRALKAHTGFEPVLEESALPTPLEAKLKELRQAQRARQRDRRR
jgi:integrase